MMTTSWMGGAFTFSTDSSILKIGLVPHIPHAPQKAAYNVPNTEKTPDYGRN